MQVIFSLWGWRRQDQRQLFKGLHRRRKSLTRKVMERKKNPKENLGFSMCYLLQLSTRNRCFQSKWNCLFAEPAEYGEKKVKQKSDKEGQQVTRNDWENTIWTFPEAEGARGGGEKGRRCQHDLHFVNPEAEKFEHI